MLDKKYVLGVDVGGTKILIGHVSKDGAILYKKRYPMDRTDQNTTLSSIWNALDNYFLETKDMPKPIAIGIGTVGAIDPKNGVWIKAVNLPIRESVEVVKEIGKRYGLIGAIDNDVHAATLAEMLLGEGRNHKDFVYLNLGTGIAAGLVSDGRLIRGSKNNAGEIGHMIVEPSGQKCKCGQRGCLEMTASGGDIMKYAKHLAEKTSGTFLNKLVKEGTLTATAIFTAADEGDLLAVKICRRIVKDLGIAIINLMTLLDPELVVLGGGLLNDGFLYKQLCSYLKKNAGCFAKSADSLLISKLNPDFVGLLGASCLAWKKISLED